MKRSIFLIAVLMVALTGVWAVKYISPINAAAADETDTSLNWWEQMSVPDDRKPDSEYILDSVPDNYIPVLGNTDIFMVLDDDGNVTGYMKRLSSDDGTVTWEKYTKPVIETSEDASGIPSAYQKVAGFKNLYSYLAEDGSIKYVLYYRNPDNTYYFLPADASGNLLKEETSDESTANNADVIPENYVRVIGNIYAVYDEHNVVIGYKERVGNSVSGYTWKDVQNPFTTDVPTLPDVSTPIGPGTNIFSDAPNTSVGGNTSAPSGTHTSQGTASLPPFSFPEWSQGSLSTPTLSIPELSGTIIDRPDVSVTIPNIDISNMTSEEIEGLRTETSTKYETKIQNGYKITFETIITKVYDAAGNLVAEKTEGPTEVSREPILNDESSTANTPTPDKSLIQSTLRAEYLRVYPSVSYRTDISNELVRYLNESRSAAGLEELTQDKTDTLFVLAQLKSADLAIYQYNSTTSPMYGSFSEMLDLFGLRDEKESLIINTWSTTSTSVYSIDQRLSAISSGTRMNRNATTVAISVSEKDGRLYVVQLVKVKP